MTTLNVVDARLSRIEELLTAAPAVVTVNVADAAHLTGLSRRQVYAAIHAGELPAKTAGERTYLVRPGDLADWIDRLPDAE